MATSVPHPPPGSRLWTLSILSRPVLAAHCLALMCGPCLRKLRALSARVPCLRKVCVLSVRARGCRATGTARRFKQALGCQACLNST